VVLKNQIMLVYGKGNVNFLEERFCLQQNISREVQCVSNI
jgi:hypothetical protein